jgi:1-acyl-sn-glycerol-3-phosphate acyltransferase
VSSSSAIAVRSLVFNALFYANLIVHMLAALPTLVLPRCVLIAFVRSYALTSLWLLRVICGTTVEWRGLDKLPKAACIVACKHQSAWETFALYAVLRDPAYVLKRELMWLPLFGWYARRAGMVPVDRAAGMAALARMTARARQALARNRPVVIFPEGTRRAPGAEPSYKAGIVYLYGRAGVPCVPLALNSGLYWPRRSLRRQPGTILVEILEPIAPGLDKDAFMNRLQSAIENASRRLIAESGIDDHTSGAGVRSVIGDS